MRSFGDRYFRGFARRFDADMLRVLTRSETDGITGVICWNNDWEKQEDILKLCEQHANFVYSTVGVHPNNIKRTNDRQAAERMAKLEELAVLSQTVAIACGLDFSREVASHFAQEKMLELQLSLAVRVRLPVVVHAVEAWEPLLEKLRAHSALLGCAIVGLDAAASSIVDGFLSLPFPVYACINGDIVDPTNVDRTFQLRSLAQRLGPTRVLLTSEAPFHTPQNIPDGWVREGRNEPGNLSFLVP